MAVRLPNGSVIYVASGYGTSKVMSVLSNAIAPVATLEASHGVAVNDYVEVTSGWGRLNNKILKATAVATNDVTFGSSQVNTTSTVLYPAGAGTGTVREITGWTQILQVLAPQSDGGQQQFATAQFLEADVEIRLPTVKSASGLSFSVADDPTLTGYQLLATANDDRAARAVRVVLANGSELLYNAYISLDKTPTMTVNEISRCPVTLSFLSEPVRL